MRSRACAWVDSLIGPGGPQLLQASLSSSCSRPDWQLLRSTQWMHVQPLPPAALSLSLSPACPQTSEQAVRRAVQRAAPPPGNQLLQSLFLGLPGLPDVPQLRYQACLLVGSYAAWLGEAVREGGPPQLVAGSMRLLLAGASPLVRLVQHQTLKVSAWQLRRLEVRCACCWLVRPPWCAWCTIGPFLLCWLNSGQLTGLGVGMGLLLAGVILLVRLECQRTLLRV